MSDLPLPDLPTYTHILVASGGAPHSQIAVSRAARIAKSLGATLHLVTVVPQGGSPLMNASSAFAGGETFEAQALQDDYARREAYLHQTAAQLRGMGITVQEYLMPALKAADAILAVAQEAKVDLIVMGRKHTSAWTAALVGSVSDMVSHASPIDVLIVR